MTNWTMRNCTSFFYFSELPNQIFLFLYRQAMIDEFDLDQDGEINEQEFIAIMTDDA